MPLDARRSIALAVIARLLALLLAFGSAGAALAGGEVEPALVEPDAGVAPPPKLTLPSPAEYFSALAKSTNARWRRSYRALDPQPPADRTKAAAGLGMLIADCHLAAMARDGQRLSNVTAEVVSFSKVLGLGEVTTPGLASIAAAAELANWPGVHVGLEALLEEIGGALAKQRDPDLAKLTLISCWLRTLHVGSAIVHAGEVEDLTLAVGGEGMPQQLIDLSLSLSERTREEKSVAFLLRQGAKLARMWSPERLAAEREFTLEEVEESRRRIEGIMDHLIK